MSVHGDAGDAPLSPPASSGSIYASPDRHPGQRRTSILLNSSLARQLAQGAGGYHMTTSDELERENRHFVMSDAIIEAMEQAKQLRSLADLGIAPAASLSASSATLSSMYSSAAPALFSPARSRVSSASRPLSWAAGMPPASAAAAAAAPAPAATAAGTPISALAATGDQTPVSEALRLSQPGTPQAQPVVVPASAAATDLAPATPQPHSEASQSPMATTPRSGIYGGSNQRNSVMLSPTASSVGPSHHWAEGSSEQQMAHHPLSQQTSLDDGHDRSVPITPATAGAMSNLFTPLDEAAYAGPIAAAHFHVPTVTSTATTGTGARPSRHIRSASEGLIIADGSSDASSGSALFTRATAAGAGAAGADQPGRQQLQSPTRSGLKRVANSFHNAGASAANGDGPHLVPGPGSSHDGQTDASSIMEDPSRMAGASGGDVDGLLHDSMVPLDSSLVQGHFGGHGAAGPPPPPPLSDDGGWRHWTSSPASVALGFLRSMADRPDEEHLLASAQLIVAENEDIPQSLLPLPVVNLGDIGSMGDFEDQNPFALHQQSLQTGTVFRGNDEWAPPRNQIIFSVQKRAVNKARAIQMQGYRCAGCGMRVELNYTKKFRYCEYLGKYFCTSCHKNATRIIPARVLHFWDFRQYRVSNFSAALLDDIYTHPVYDMKSINNTALRRNKALATATTLRRQLKHLQAYLRTCRSGKNLLQTIEDPPHLASEETIYALQDLVELQAGTLLKHLTILVDLGISHVKDCPLCQAKGYICEICDRADDIIFPFEVQKVYECPKCHAVYHNKCFTKASSQCPKCARRAMWEKKRAMKPLVEEVASPVSDTGTAVPADFEQANGAAQTKTTAAAANSLDMSRDVEVDDGGGSDSQPVPLDEYLILDAEGEITPVVSEPSKKRFPSASSA